MLTLYARKEKTKDTVAMALGLKHVEDVVLYSDKNCQNEKGRFPWYSSKPPSIHAKKVIFNCFRWNLIWAH